MKRNVFILALCALFLQSKAQERIMVIADPHVTPQSVIDAEPDFDTYMIKQRKMLDLSEPMWYALMDTALKYHPDLLLIPGDLTRDGEPEAHTLVSNSLLALQQAGIPSIVIPGNHDNTSGFTPAAVEPIKGLTVLAFYDGVSLDWLAAEADAAVAKGNTVIAMTHRQLIDHFDGKGTLESSARMTNADTVRSVLAHHGVHLVLTGHFHVNSISTWRDSITGDSLVELSTGSPITYPCPYRWLTLSPDRSQISVQTDYITSLGEIADMHTYSREWMAEHTRNLLPVIAQKAINKSEALIAKLKKSIFTTGLAMILENCMPDQARLTQLIEKHLGTLITNMYLLHSDGNELTHPEAAEFARNFPAGIQALMAEMMAECADEETLNFFVSTVMDIVQVPLQSILTDVTGYASPALRNCTDDLQPVLTIGTPQGQSIDQLTDDLSHSTHKYLHNGQLIIRHNAAYYNAQGILMYNEKLLYNTNY